MLATAPPGVREAVALGAYTGLRQGDVLTLPWAAIKDGWIRWRQAKTGEDVWIPVHRDLAAILARTDRRATVIVAGARDSRPYTSDGFRTLFFRLVRRLESEGVVGKGLTFHGLRHGLATRLADAGADDRTIAAITGHKQVAMVQRYTRTADRATRPSRHGPSGRGEDGGQGVNKRTGRLENRQSAHGKMGQIDCPICPTTP